MFYKEIILKKMKKVLVGIFTLTIILSGVSVHVFANEESISSNLSDSLENEDTQSFTQMPNDVKAPESTMITITHFSQLEKGIQIQRVSIGTALDYLNLPKQLVAYTNQLQQNGTDFQTITIENVIWESTKVYDPNVKDRYVFSPKVLNLPEGITLSENVKRPMIEVYVSEFRDIRWENYGTHFAHYINSFNYNEEMFVYGMNYNLNYAHPSPVWGNDLPKYATGYLTVDDFKSPSEYFEFISRASKLLFAGYPNNGANLYEIVESEDHKVTVEDFNKMLVPPAELVEIFPELKHYVFEYPLSKEETDVIVTFVNKVVMGDFVNNVNDIDAAAIMNMPFYKAATCFTLDSGSTPLEIFEAWVSSDYYVTKEVAYLSTQHAFSTLLNEYGIPHNQLDHEAQISLPKALLEFSKKGQMATEIPQSSAIGLTGKICFSYNPEDKLWYSEPIMIHEPYDYNGLYKLILPKGIKTVHNINYIYADEKYRLVSDHEVQPNEVIAVETTIPWLKVFEQFSPENKLGSNGKAFEGMAGAIVNRTPLRIEFPHTTQSVGKLSISAIAEGKELESKEFKIQLELNDNNLNGIYGDVEFVNGIAKFTLRNGESKEVSYLPAGLEYVLRAEEGTDFSVESTGEKGIIKEKSISLASFKFKPINGEKPPLDLTDPVPPKNPNSDVSGKPQVDTQKKTVSIQTAASMNVRLWFILFGISILCLGLIFTIFKYKND